ncbi:O-antigen polymerase [Lonepinella koalarum]|uniref:Oligosaccharide repeat unit polymerase n=1 Tax=Lonepinella koalarum TaxID=53417 RepID=A0A4R1KYG5_9PAST|nr:O-antigen polymerase [Lonepinella koalarum]MDH2926804.1 hypothetical protein [Lonepinella koalarum]TCK70538.1 hypothetical protein EV692_0817 [Lonepinella koalarum]TFJ90082.1 oligosaccharide repeat unit polymerase [Lonepinella koalarum]
MAILLGMMQFFLILFICKREYDHNSLSVFLWATLLMMFGIPHLLTTFSNETGYLPWVIDDASVFVIGFCFIYILARETLSILFLSKKTKVRAFEVFDHSLTVMRILFWGLFFVVFYKLYEIYQFAGSLLSSSWGSGREMILEQDYLSFSKLILSLYYPFSSALLYALIIKNKKYTILSALLIMMCVLFTRNRIEVLPLLICVMIYLLYVKRNMTFGKIALFGFIAVFSLYLINALLMFRYYGTVDTFLNSFNFSEFNRQVLEHISSGQGELSLREVFYYFINNNNNFSNFNEGHTYIRMLMVLIPSGLAFGLKPPDFAISMGSAYRSDLVGFSTHPTLFGDCYANLGDYGIFLGIFWAFYVVAFDHLVSAQKSRFFKLVLLVSVACSYIIMGRGSVYNAFSILVFSIILSYFIYCMLKLVFNKNLRKRL